MEDSDNSHNIDTIPSHFRRFEERKKDNLEGRRRSWEIRDLFIGLLDCPRQCDLAFITSAPRLSRSYNITVNNIMKSIEGLNTGHSIKCTPSHLVPPEHGSL